jgi:hypothetical protein
LGIDADDIKKAMSWADEYGGVPVPQSTKTGSVVVQGPSVHVDPWRKAATEWQQAMHECGIIRGKDGELRLEVWRGSTYLLGYVSCIKEKREIITKIGQSLRAFNQGETPIRSLSIMLQADPGAGKTFLAKSLAKAFGTILRHFSSDQPSFK